MIRLRLFRGCLAIAFAAMITTLPIGTIAAGDDTAFYRRAKVANYTLPGADFPDPAFESLSFWADERGMKRVRYSYGPDAREITLRPLGRTADGSGFALRFPNGLVLDVHPDGDGWRVRDRTGGYDKRFTWMYEGPVDGRGTFCTPCVEEQDAAAFVRRHFLGD